VCLSVSLLVTFVSLAKTTEPIEMPFGADAPGPKEPYIRWVQISPREQEIFEVVQPAEKHWEFLLRCTQQKELFHPQ